MATTALGRPAAASRRGLRYPGDDRQGLAGEHELRCGGVDMIGPTAPAPAGVQLDPAHAGETLIGKRYVNADESLELLCTKGGKGSLSLDGVALEIKQARQLPSSD